MVLISGWVSTDGGRTEAGIKDTNDCAVRAYALFKGIPYAEAHALFKKEGRKNGRGTSFTIIRSLLGGKGENGGRMTLASLRSKFPQGRVYAIKRGHAFAIIDGVIHDTWQVGNKSRVLEYWTDSAEPSIIPQTEKRDNTALKTRAGKIINAYENRSLPVANMVALVSKLLVISPANARYYVSRVFAYKPV